MIEFSTFKNIKSNKPQLHSLDLSTFIKGMITPVSESAENKSDLPLWSPTIFDGTRCAENAVKITCLVFDVDDGITPFNTWQMFAREWNVIAHTSFSSRPNHHKYRIILPLARPIPADDWTRASIAANELWAKVVGRKTEITREEERAWKRAALNDVDHPLIWRRFYDRGEADQKAIKDRARIYYRFALPASSYAPTHPLAPRYYHYCDAWDGGINMTLDYSHVELPKRKIKQIDRSKPVGMREALTDPRLRMEIAILSSASINGNTARRITCPQCNRNSVWFAIDIDNTKQQWATCNHVESCGWWGSLEALA